MGKRVGPLRVVLDTNVVLSALLFGGRVGAVRDAWVAGRLVPLASRETFTELRRALEYPKFALTRAEIAGLIQDELLPFFEVVDDVAPVSGLCRDPHDDKFIALVIAGHCAVIVSGDRDLLALGKHQGIRLITVASLLLKLG